MTFKEMLFIFVHRVRNRIIDGIEIRAFQVFYVTYYKGTGDIEANFGKIFNFSVASMKTKTADW
jgi:hypothetical protein